MTNIDNLGLPPLSAQQQLLPVGSNLPVVGLASSTREIKKRNRIPVSCNECRRRKLRLHHFQTTPELMLDATEMTPVPRVSNAVTPPRVNSPRHPQSKVATHLVLTLEPVGASPIRGTICSNEFIA
jgi:hypothetical protein